MIPEREQQRLDRQKRYVAKVEKRFELFSRLAAAIIPVLYLSARLSFGLPETIDPQFYLWVRTPLTVLLIVHSLGLWALGIYVKLQCYAADGLFGGEYGFKKLVGKYVPRTLLWVFVFAIIVEVNIQWLGYAPR